MSDTYQHHDTARFSDEKIDELYSKLGVEDFDKHADKRFDERFVNDFDNDCLIQLDDISYSYQGLRASHDKKIDEAALPYALKHVNLRIASGEFVGIIGPSGAGKSTLASIISGAIPHHYHGTLYGSARVAGRDTCEVSLTDISQVVGSILQDIDAQMVASEVEDELLFGLENFGIPRDQIEVRLQQALKATGITELRDREIATLSGGQKQKVALAAILALQPRILVLDEPTAALDPESSQVIFEILQTLSHMRGITVLVIEQKVALLADFCERIVVMNQGSIAADDTPRKVFAQSALLRQIGVDTPRMTRVSNQLYDKGLLLARQTCLSVTETAQLIDDVVKHGVSALDADTDEKIDAGATEKTSVSQHHAAQHMATTQHMASPQQGQHDPQREADPQHQPILQVDDVSFTYSSGDGVLDVNFALYPGDVLAVVGQNGAGKTTLTKLINGLLKPRKGNVTVAGLNTKTTPTSTLATQVATLFQNPDRQLSKDTVLEELIFSLTLHGTDEATATQTAQRFAKHFKLPSDASPFQLSRGQRQLLALGCVLILDPKLIILDEPTSGLDYLECMTIMQQVKAMAHTGCAVLMVCHDMEVVSDFADRLLVMAHGCVLKDAGLLDSFTDEKIMKQAYLQPPQVMQLSQALTRKTSAAFEGLTQVNEIVTQTERLIEVPSTAEDRTQNATPAQTERLIHHD